MQSQTGTVNRVYVGPLKSVEDAELREDMEDCTKYRKAILEQVIQDDPSAPEELHVIMAGVKRSLQPILERRIALLYDKLVSCSNLMEQAGIAIKVYLSEYANMINDLLCIEDTDLDILASLSALILGRLCLFRHVQIRKVVGCNDLKVSVHWGKHRTEVYHMKSLLMGALRTLGEQFEIMEELESVYAGVVRESLRYNQDLVADHINPYLRFAETVSRTPSYELVEQLLKAEETLFHKFDESNGWLDTQFDKHAKYCQQVITQSNLAVGSISIGPTGFLRSRLAIFGTSLGKTISDDIVLQYLLIRKMSMNPTVAPPANVPATGIKRTIRLY
ncbi:hypothetical protein HDU76_013844 [Blyttiomyces sp. JEL0837]|nr:hypothetical protein HDU76_013844 [Blyttiomyces sp. JEL0837]